MSGPELLFTLRNNFYLGAYQAAIAEAADLERLSEADSVERDCFVYRSYIELGSFEVSLTALVRLITKSALESLSLYHGRNSLSMGAACSQRGFSAVSICFESR